MAEALNELPLALFTTLAPIGAGAFIALAIAFATCSFSDEQLKKIDRFTLLPLLVAFAGLLAAFAHLTNPFNALNLALTIGRTPMANEIAAFGVFMVVAFVYWIVAMAGKLSLGARKAVTIIVAVLAVVFACFTGAAYMLDTIPTWNTAFTPIAIIGIELFGGMVLGCMVLHLSKASIDLSNRFTRYVLAIFTIGFAMAIIGCIGVFVLGATSTTTVIDAGENALTLVPAFVASIILATIGYALGRSCIRGMPFSSGTAKFTVTVAMIAVAVFLARLVFYGMQISIGM